MHGRVRGGRASRKRNWVAALVCVASILTVVSGALGSGAQRSGGILRIAIADFDYVDPALAYTHGSWAILDTTCARLMTYPDKPAPEGLRLVPEVAKDFPKISRNGKTYTFSCEGASASATAHRFVPARSHARSTARSHRAWSTPGAQCTPRTSSAPPTSWPARPRREGVTAQGNTLVVRFTRPVADFAATTTMPFFCAVPPMLPPEPEGLRTFPSAGPYVITEYRPGERVTIRRNRFYGGSRPHHVDGFDVDLGVASASDGLDQVEAGKADWGRALAANYFEPGRDLVAKFGVNKGRFFVRPGLQLRHIVFNNARPLFRDNVRLRKAVSFALNRRELARAATTAPLAYRLTDQYLPPSLPGYRDAKLYPLERPNLARAKRTGTWKSPRGKGRAVRDQHSSTIGCRADRKATAGRDRARRRVEALPDGTGSRQGARHTG